MATRPRAERRPSGLVVVLAFSVALAAAAALVVVALLLRDDGGPASVPAPVVDLAGIPQQGTVLGAPEAKVTLIEYADLQCPACRSYTLNVFPAIVDANVRNGLVKTEFRGYPFIGSDSLKAQRFVLAAGLQNKLWQLQEALYRNQGRENEGWVTDDLLRELAGQIPGLDVEKLFADAESNEVASAVEAGFKEAQAAGIPGTPTFFVKIGDAAPYVLQSPLDSASLQAALDDALRE